MNSLCSSPPLYAEMTSHQSGHRHLKHSCIPLPVLPALSLFSEMICMHIPVAFNRWGSSIGDILGSPFQVYSVGVIVPTNTHFCCSQHNKVSLEPPLKAPHAIGLTYGKGVWPVHSRDLSPFVMRLPVISSNWAKIQKSFCPTTFHHNLLLC